MSDSQQEALNFMRRHASLKRTERILAVLGFGAMFSSLPVLALFKALPGLSAYAVTAQLSAMASGFVVLLGMVIVSAQCGKMVKEALATKDKHKAGVLLVVYNEQTRLGEFANIGAK